MQDGQGRTIDYLRLSVTDKCNLRCQYCMPEEGVCALRHEDMLRHEEILRCCTILARMGIRKLKITGGEPLIRKNIESLLHTLYAIDDIEQMTLTTNGQSLEEKLPALVKAGVSAINISLDTLDAETYASLTRGGDLRRVIRAVDAATEYPVTIKINCVALHQSEKEILDLIDFAQTRHILLRFIELMPIGLGKAFEGLSLNALRHIIEHAHGAGTQSAQRYGNGPARYYDYPGLATSIGFISAVSEAFCSECNRIRLTADGDLKLCLHYEIGLSMKTLLRSDASDVEIEQAILRALADKPKQHGFCSAQSGAVERHNMNRLGG